MSKKITAVEWLIDQIHSDNYQRAFGQTYISDVIVEQAKEKEQAKDRLIEVLTNQVMDLSMMSKIELGDDVIEEIKRLREIINRKNDD